MSSHKDWIDITTALLTPVIAIVGISIAVLQYKVNKSRFKHELFDKRYAIYEATQRFIGQVCSSGKMKDDERIEFLKSTKGSFALYDSTINGYLDEIHKQTLQLHLHQSKHDHDKEYEILSWFGEQLHVSPSVFKGHLKIE